MSGMSPEEYLRMAGGWSGSSDSALNHFDTDNDDTFSGTGDVTRVTGSNTSERSRAANAAAADTESDAPMWGRAEPVAGSGGSVGDDDMINHVYGES